MNHALGLELHALGDLRELHPARAHERPPGLLGEVDGEPGDDPAHARRERRAQATPVAISPRFMSAMAWTLLKWFRTFRRSLSSTWQYPGSKVITRPSIVPVYGAAQPTDLLNRYLPPGLLESFSHIPRIAGPGLLANSSIMPIVARSCPRWLWVHRITTSRAPPRGGRGALDILLGAT